MTAALCIIALSALWLAADRIFPVKNVRPCGLIILQKARPSAEQQGMKGRVR